MKKETQQEEDESQMGSKVQLRSSHDYPLEPREVNGCN